MAIIRNLPMADYHAHQALSNSKLSDFIKNGAAWWRSCYVDGTIPRRDSAALKEGRLFDTLLFDGQTGFDRDYRLQPDTYLAEPKKKGDAPEQKPWNLNSNTCKAIVAEAATGGQSLVTRAAIANANRMLASVRSHSLATEALAACDYQVSIRRKLPALGIELQARPDGLSRKPISVSAGMRFTLDAKKTACWSDWFNEADPTSPRAGSPIYDYGYYRQGAIDNCLVALEPEVGDTKHFLLVVEDCEPYRVALVEMTEEYLNAGWQEVEHHLARLASYLTGKAPWPHSPQELVTMAPPTWIVDRANRFSESAVAEKRLGGG